MRRLAAVGGDRDRRDASDVAARRQRHEGLGQRRCGRTLVPHSVRAMSDVDVQRAAERRVRDVVGDRVQAGVGDADADRRQQVDRAQRADEALVERDAQARGLAGVRLQVVDLARDRHRGRDAEERRRDARGDGADLAWPRAQSPRRGTSPARTVGAAVGSPTTPAGSPIVTFLTSSLDVFRLNAMQKSRCAPAARVASAPWRPVGHVVPSIGERLARPRPLIGTVAALAVPAAPSANATTRPPARPTIHRPIDFSPDVRFAPRFRARHREFPL